MLEVFDSIYTGSCVCVRVCMSVHETDIKDTCVQKNVYQSANNVYV